MSQSQVIMVNDSPKAVVIGSERDGIDKVNELSEADFQARKNNIVGKSITEKMEQYKNTYFWHIERVPVFTENR